MRNINAVIICIVLLFVFKTSVYAQAGEQIAASETRLIQPVKSETVAEIMERAKNFPDVKMIERPEREYPDRSNLPQNPFAKPLSSFPVVNNLQNIPTTDQAQTPGTSFNGVTGPTETGAFPPDDMGAIGPTQYVVFVNGRLRTFNKTTGVADGVLNVNPDVFFASVMTPVGGTVTQVFTSDPRVRYDRLSGKWILIIIDVPLNATGGTPVANRVLIAYSNSSTITGGTTWTFSQFTGEAGKFTDYETLGVDANALYIGTNMFSLAGSFTGTNGYVINRATLLSGGAYTVYSFLGLVPSAAGAGPFTPQGVDNFDIAATQGYFIGADNATFGTLMIRRVSTPAGVPTISANISLTVSSTRSPRTVPHLGNTGSTNGNLDALDDRLFAAVMRNGHLWTTHNIGVTSAGVATTTNPRNGARWYDIINLGTTPAVNQSGTVFDNNATLANARDFSIPTIMVSGQGHAAFSFTTAGTNFRSDAYTTGRWSGDASGTMQTPIATTTSSTAYNPSGDPGGAGGRRWGDYSYVSLDPIDDMTMWMIGQYCVGANTYGCNVTKLLAPPPATPASCSPSSTPAGQLSVNVIVTGTAVSGSGFYDPGTNLSAPALPFNHITATVSGTGVTVNSITYTDPTHVTLNLNTVGATNGARNITITNPDGQSLTGTGIFTINGVVPITLTGLQGKLNNNLTVSLSWSTATESGNKGFMVERTETNDQNGWAGIGFVTGAGISVVTKNYALIDNHIQLNKIYRYRLKQIDIDGNFSYSNEIVIRVKDLQKNVLLLTNYPNPFKSKSTLKYNLPSGGMVNLKVFDILGKEVASLVNGFQQSGIYSTEFNAEKLGKGIYFCKLSFEGETITNRMILIE